MSNTIESTELNICPCGLGNNCFNSKVIDFSQCFDCGLTKMTDDELSKMNLPKIYEDFKLGNWIPYFQRTKEYMVYLEGSSKEDAKYVFVKMDENYKPIKDSQITFLKNDFFNLLKLLNNGI